MKILMVAAILVCGGTEVFGATAEYVQRKPQTVAGQNFSFVFNNLPAASARPFQFFVHARGDYVHAYSAIAGEFLTWDIEGMVSGGPVGRFLGVSSTVTPVTIDDGVGGPFDFINYAGGIGDVEFKRTYVLPADLLTQILADGKAQIFVDLGPNVDGGNFVEVGLSYNLIPEPGSWMLAAIAASLSVVKSRR